VASVNRILTAGCYQHLIHRVPEVRWHFDAIPEDESVLSATVPYVGSYRLLSSVGESYLSSGKELRTWPLQVDVFGLTHEGVQDRIEEVRNQFEDTSPNLTDSTVSIVRIMNGSDTVGVDPDKTTEAQEIYHGIQILEISVEYST